MSWHHSLNQRFKKLRLTVFFAMIPALLYVMWSANQVSPLEVELTVELLEGKKTVAALFCKNDESKFYTGEFRVEFPFDQTTLIDQNTYLFSTMLPCESDMQKLRFDPVWDEGTVMIKRLRFHSYRWFDFNLENEFSTSMRILNSIKEFSVSDEGILVKSAGNDPFIQISDTLQDYLRPDFRYLLGSFLLALFIGTLTLRLLVALWLVLVDRIKIFEVRRIELSQTMDRSLQAFSISTLKMFSEKKPVNWVAAGSS